MLTPSEYDHLCDQLIQLYAALDESIIEDITRRLMKTGYVTDTAKWQAEQLQKSGMLYEDVLAEIAKRSNATQAHVRALFEDAGVQSIRNDNQYYRAAGLEGIVRMSDAALQTLNAGYIKCAGNLQNLTLTTANTAQQAYIQASNLAYMQVTSGTMDFNTAVRHAIQTAAAAGSSVLYPSGHCDHLDVAVRRAVLTGVGQTVRQLSLINAQDMGCDLMEITAHGGARPPHAAWQGKIVSLSGRRGYLTPKSIGYGTGDGFGGWNCRHDWHPFFEGISKRAYSNARLKELNEPHIEIDGEKYTDYEVSQMQRALERKIRKQKRQVAAANAAVQSAPDEAAKQAMKEDFTAQSVKLKQAEQELKDFCKQTGFLPDTSRVWVNGFGRSVSQKAVHANKNILQFLDQSDIINIDTIMKGYKKYIQKYPDSGFNYYMVNYKLAELGIKKGVALPAKPKNAAILPDESAKHDKYHIMHRMMERNVTDDELRQYAEEAKVMFVQWGGQRQAFYSPNGVSVLHHSKDGWIYKTAWNTTDFDDETQKILEVINRYVKG